MKKKVNITRDKIKLISIKVWQVRLSERREDWVGSQIEFETLNKIWWMNTEFYFVLNTQVNLCFSQIQNRRDMKPQEEKKIIKTYKGGK